MYNSRLAVYAGPGQEGIEEIILWGKEWGPNGKTIPIGVYKLDKTVTKAWKEGLNEE